MNPTEGCDRHTMPENTAKCSIPTVLARPKAVAVLDAGLPPGERAFPRADVVVDSDIISQHGTAPTVVIAGDHQNRCSRFVQLSEGSEHAKARTWNDCPPLEPELEEVSINDERRGAPLEMLQESQQIAFDHWIGKSEMQIGDDIRRCGQHALILARGRQLYKLRCGSSTAESRVHSCP